MPGGAECGMKQCVWEGFTETQVGVKIPGGEGACPRPPSQMGRRRLERPLSDAKETPKQRKRGRWQPCRPWLQRKTLFLLFWSAVKPACAHQGHRPPCAQLFVGEKSWRREGRTESEDVHERERPRKTVLSTVPTPMLDDT